MDNATFDYMTRIDPSDCVRRVICDVSTGNNDFQELATVLNILPKEGVKIPLQLKRLSNQLKTAQKYGEQFKSIRACETAFKSPLSGYELKDLMGNDDGSLENNLL